MRMTMRGLSVLLLFNSLSSFGQCDTVDLALGRPASASSLENPVEPASLAFDGDTTSRWSSMSSDPQTIAVDLGAVHQLCKVTLFWEAAYGKDFTIELSNDSVTWSPVATITGNSALKDTITFTGSGRYVRMVGTARGTGFGYSLYEFQVFGPPTFCNTINLAMGQPVVVSSTQPGFPAANAVDGDIMTRWSSDVSDPQFIYVDLGSIRTICQVAIYWEAAYAASYTIDVSNDLLGWTTIATVPSNAAQTNILNISGTGRYLRVSGLTRATAFGYSIFELQVRDQNTPLPITLADFQATNEGNQYSLLEWRTDIETNNRYFDIERSANGSTYTAIGRVAGAGNSSTPVNYRWEDPLPLKGINYYRLKQVDLDGHSSYSKVVTVLIGGDPGIGLSVYPNPAKDLVNIVAPGDVDIQGIGVYNSVGSELGRYDHFSNNHTVQIPVSMLSSGLYTLKIITSKGAISVKLYK